MGPLGPEERRVLVAGTSGSGKTTLAQRVSEVLGVPHVEIDGLFHGPDWVPRRRRGRGVPHESRVWLEGHLRAVV
jgi:gluconate kinase